MVLKSNNGIGVQTPSWVDGGGGSDPLAWMRECWYRITNCNENFTVPTSNWTFITSEKVSLKSCILYDFHRQPKTIRNLRKKLKKVLWKAVLNSCFQRHRTNQILHQLWFSCHCFVDRKLQTGTNSKRN